MRRTYRSKKDTGNGLDRRDFLHTTDEKSSLFDAFYIQNIKQTKRELSCMGSSNHYGIASNKVRKRKYIKRIVKEVEPIVQESTSHSAFLTPDRSLRVNKGHDLFDQLLNSSPQWPEEAKPVENKLFDKQPKREGKTYTRKRTSKVKKYNYSSTDSSESEKENSPNKDTQNMSDVGSYKLIVEKQPSISPKCDESINNIVNNFSFIKNVNCRRSSSNFLKEKFRKNNHRLTRTVQSPVSQNSPLCSTPFKEKYRGGSIFKFSPINDKNTEESPNYVTIIEEKDASIMVVDNTDSIISQIPNNDLKSPVSHLPKEKYKTNKLSMVSAIYEDTEASLLDVNKTDSKEDVELPQQPLTYAIVSPIIQTSVNRSKANSKTSQNSVENPSQLEIIHEDSIVNTDKEQAGDTTEKSQFSSIEISSFQTTEPEPFLGFSNSTIVKAKTNEVINCADDSIETCEAEESVKENSVEHNSMDTSEIEIAEKQNSICTDKSMETSVPEVLEEQNSSCSQIIENSITSSNVSSNSDDDRESLYDTCNSDQSLDNVQKREPIVLLEKLNDSAFLKYYEKMADYGSQDEKMYNSTDESQSYASLEDSTDGSNKSIENVEFKDTQNTDTSNTCEDTTSNDEEVKSVDEDKCMSFVTTRRRNEVTNDSLLLGFDNSYGSASNSDCDKTVLSNNKNNINHSREDAIDSKYDDDSKKVNEIQTEKSPVLGRTFIDNSVMEKTRNNIARYTENTRISHITTRKSSSVFRESVEPVNARVTSFEVKPAIVLQPGKKWERSLSIYRRMTMMTDHFDHSILEDEPMHTKGRKYRQSVINTMEMQDHTGSLHNESINSRRSTFVSKPCRSTIRIVKEANTSRSSLCNTTLCDDLKGFVNEDCDDTIVELSKLSIAESDHEVTVLEKLHDSKRVATARDYVLRRCDQTEAILFDECYPDTVLKNCRKIGEGVYGEVFLWRAGDGRARVMKIVPVAGNIKVNGESQKDFHEIISEIVIAMELSALRAPIAAVECHFDEGKDIAELDLHDIQNATDVFNEVLAVRCVYGAYPSRLLDLWDLYDECKGSENDNPAILPVDQQYIVLELANAGQDLESYQFNSAEQAHALFLQVAFGLAVGEEAYQFEHRDLHWGNVLIAPTDQKLATFVLRGRAHRVARCGVAATIIDYSLSRLSLPLAADCAALYNDLANDDGLFDAVGDYQFEVYRLMRDKLRNDWKNFEPYTNILWLHYTVDKMITALRYKRTNTKIHKHYIAKLKAIKNRILTYGSAVQFVLTDDEF